MEIFTLLVILLIVLKLQNILFKKNVFKKLDYRCRFSQDEVFDGDELFLVETLENNKCLPVPWLKVSIHSSQWLDFAASRSVIDEEIRHVSSSFYLKGYQRTTRSWKLKCLRRGVFTIENVTFIGGDLFGLSSVSVPVPVNTTIKVYPSIVDMENIFVPANLIQGDTIVSRWIIDDPFIVSGAREYTPRDSMNRIHWFATAREGKLMVKKNDFTSRQSLAVILNVKSIENEYSDTVDKDTVEFGIKVAATVLDKALGMGLPVRLGTNGSTTERDREPVFTDEAAGREHVCELLEILARLKLKAVKDFEAFMDEIGEAVQNSDIVLITAYINDSITEKAAELGCGSNRVTILVLDDMRISDFPKSLNVYYIPDGWRVKCLTNPQI